MSRYPAIELLPQICHRYRCAELVAVTALVSTFILAMVFALVFFLGRGVRPQIFAEVEVLLGVCSIVWLFCLGRATSCANSISFAIVFLPVDSERGVGMIEKSSCLRDVDDFCKELLKSLKAQDDHSAGRR